MQRMQFLALAVATGAMAIGVGVIAAPAANASGRPCGQASSISGTGSDGTPFTLKSMYDDDGPTPGVVVVGEEFEINTEAVGQTWTITYSDNGTVFLNDTQVSTATGIREQGMTTAQPGTQTMVAKAVNLGNGETIVGTVQLPTVPSKCGH